MTSDFKEHSGLETKTTETETMWLGEWKDRIDEPFGFKWLKESVNAVGVFFLTTKKLHANRLNFCEKIRKNAKHLATEKSNSL